MLLRSLRRAISVEAQKLNASLLEIDPDVHKIIELEKRRQATNIVLIASENFTSKSVLEALGSVMTNKYSEGYPGARYYGGNQYIDLAEELCRKRALEAFRLDPEQWGVNVQPLSGAPCNFYVYTAVLGPHERMMALDLPHGGHLSHGFQTETRKVSATSIYFESVPYRLNEETGYIDYDKLAYTASVYRPKLIVGGASAYPREYDYQRMRDIANDVNALFMYDMAHISGLVAAGVLLDPFKHADIVTTTTHKSLRGPRGAMIFYRKGMKKDKKGKEVPYDLQTKIDNAVFPGHQGGPHNHTITALAVALKEATTPEFKQYGRQILKNAQALANALQSRGFRLVSGGTDNHLMLVDLRSKDMDGARVEKVLELSNIAVNKNTIPGDKSAVIPSGLRLGTPAMTSRGFMEKDFEKVAEWIDRAVEITKEIKAETEGKKLADFITSLNKKEWPKITQLRNEIEEYALKFPTIG
jgi:glycine hydroxymethyltransferase